MNWQDFIKFIFGDNVSISSVLSPLLAILVPILTIFFNRVKNKLLLSESSNNQKDKQIASQTKKIEELEKGLSYLANMISTAYLSSNTIPVETKKVIGTYAEKLDKLADIELTKETEKLINNVANYIPNIVDKKEELLEITEEAEKIIDELNDASKAAIDKLKL